MCANVIPGILSLSLQSVLYNMLWVCRYLCGGVCLLLYVWEWYNYQDYGERNYRLLAEIRQLLRNGTSSSVQSPHHSATVQPKISRKVCICPLCLLYPQSTECSCPSSSFYRSFMLPCVMALVQRSHVVISLVGQWAEDKAVDPCSNTFYVLIYFLPLTLHTLSTLYISHCLFFRPQSPFPTLPSPPNPLLLLLLFIWRNLLTLQTPPSPPLTTLTKNTAHTLPPPTLVCMYVQGNLL